MEVTPYIILLFNALQLLLVRSGYPPTGDEVRPGSVLLPASRRGRYLANMVRRQAVDGTGIKFNKDADRMNAEAKKKVDVLSDELMPYIMAEQERRVTLYRRVMTAIQNGEKGTTIAELRNKPPVIIRKGILYRCPANRAPKEPDGSGNLLCEDGNAPTAIIYDSCLSAEDRELFRAGDKYFFCNRHKTEGPDLPRNDTVVFACSPQERTSLNYTMVKCALEDTDDVIVHYRYYPDRTYKFVNELDPDHEVCDHWNPCQIGYIYRMASVDQAIQAKDLFHYEQIVPGVPEEIDSEGVHVASNNYTSGEVKIKIPDNSRVKRFIKTTKDETRRSGSGIANVNERHIIQTIVKGVLSVTFNFVKWSNRFYGIYYVVFENKSTRKETRKRIIELKPSGVLVHALGVVSLHGQSLGVYNVPYTCNRCTLQSVVIRSSNTHMFNMDITKFTTRIVNGKKAITLDFTTVKPEHFGDYYAIINNGDGNEERVLLASVHAIPISPLNKSVIVGSHSDEFLKYTCADCEVTDVLCNGQSVLKFGRVSIVPVSNMISFNFPRFENENACVYLGFFKRQGKTYVKVLAIFENVVIPNVQNIPGNPLEPIKQDIPFTCTDCKVLEVYVNGLRLPERKGKKGPKSAGYEASSSIITILIDEFSEEYAGVYQAVFDVNGEIVTKTILYIANAEKPPSPDDDKGSGDDKKPDDKDKKEELNLAPMKKSLKVGGQETFDVTYNTAHWKASNIMCRNKKDPPGVTIEQDGKIKFDFKSFKDDEACVYIATFTNINDPKETLEEVIAEIENVTPTKAQAEGTPDKPLTFTVPIACASTWTIKEIYIKGTQVTSDPKQDISYNLDTAVPPTFIKIDVTKFSAAFAGIYQATFVVNAVDITKTIAEITIPDESKPPVKGPDLKLVPARKSLLIGSKDAFDVTYNVADWIASDIMCRDTKSPAEVTVAKDGLIKFDFPAFTDANACVYIATFTNLKTQEKLVKEIAVIESVSLISKQPGTAGAQLDLTIPIFCPKTCKVSELHVGGTPILASSTNEHYFEVDKKNAKNPLIKVHIKKFVDTMAGIYQATFDVNGEIITKTITEVTGTTQTPGDLKLVPAKKKRIAVDAADSIEVTFDETVYDLKDISCKGTPLPATDYQIKASTITLDFKKFDEKNACVYVATFEKKGTQEKVTETIAVIENDYVTLQPTLEGTDGAELVLTTPIWCEQDCSAVKAVYVKDQKIDAKDATATPPQEAYFEVIATKNTNPTIKITIKKFSEVYEGTYQVNCEYNSKPVTKTIAEVTGPQSPSSPPQTPADDLQLKLVHKELSISKQETFTVPFNTADFTASNFMCRGVASTMPTLEKDGTIKFVFQGFKDDEACVYYATFTNNKDPTDTRVKEIAEIENVSVTNPKLEEKGTKNQLVNFNVKINCLQKCTVKKVFTLKAELPSDTTKDDHYSAAAVDNAPDITINIKSASEAHEGIYQATFDLNGVEVTKTIALVTSSYVT